MSANLITKFGISKRHRNRLTQAKCAGTKHKIEEIEIYDLKNNFLGVSSSKICNLGASRKEIIDQDFLSNSTEKSDQDPLNINIIDKLTIWAQANNIPHKVFSDLLQILRQAGLEVFNDTRTLLETPITVIQPDVKETILKNVHELLLVLKVQNVQTINKISTLEQKVSTMQETVLTLEKKVDLSSKMLGRTTKLALREPRTNHKNFKLPLETLEEIDLLNQLLKDDDIFNDFKRRLKSIINSSKDENLAGSFNKIISNEAVFDTNWSGTRGKQCFANYNHLCRGIFEALKNETFGQSDFEILMKKFIKYAHKRVHSVNFRKREKIKLN